MKIAGRILSWILLAAVLLALGDAPYVDELFDAITPAAAHAPDAAQDSGSTGNPHSGPGNPFRAVRLYQALASLFTAPPDIAVPPMPRVATYRAADFRTPASADPYGIERPPTDSAA